MFEVLVEFRSLHDPAAKSESSAGEVLNTVL